MGKSQQRRLRRATTYFGITDWYRWYSSKHKCADLALQRKKEAGVRTYQAGSGVAREVTQVYCSSLTHEQNQEQFGYGN